MTNWVLLGVAVVATVLCLVFAVVLVCPPKEGQRRGALAWCTRVVASAVLLMGAVVLGWAIGIGLAFRDYTF